MIVYPGILTKSVDDVFSRISLFGESVDGFHIDIADGKYVENTTVSVEELGFLPGGFFEAHLMVEDPYSYFDVCKQAGFSRVLVHLDAIESGSYVAALQAQNHVHALGMEFGLVFKRGQDIVNHDLLGRFDHIMIMTINLGFSGMPFKEDQLTQIRKVRSWLPALTIAADGHVDNLTAPAIIEAGATHLISTSYLSDENVIEKYSLLKGM